MSVCVHVTTSRDALLLFFVLHVALALSPLHCCASPLSSLRPLCFAVWCGVVWCGVLCCGVVWCAVLWCAVLWCPQIGASAGMELLQLRDYVAAYLNRTASLPRTDVALRQFVALGSRLAGVTFLS